MTRPPARRPVGPPSASTAAFYIPPGGIRTLTATLPTLCTAELPQRQSSVRSLLAPLCRGDGAALRRRRGPSHYVRVSLCARAGTSAAARRSAAHASGGATPTPPTPPAPPPAPLSPPPSLAASTCDRRRDRVGKRPLRKLRA